MKIKYIFPAISAFVLISCGGKPVVEETENPFAELTEIMYDIGDDLYKYSYWSKCI